MNKLRYSLQQNDPIELTLTTDKEYFVGRDSNCDIILESYKGISRKHIRIYYAENAWHIEKLSSIGDFPTEPLKNQTRFDIGPYEFVFVADERTELNNPSMEHSRTLALKGPSSPAESSNDVMDATVVGIKKLLPYLKIEWPDRASPEVFQLKGEKWILGRDPKCDIPIEYAEMSRHHIELHIDITKIYVQDLGSSNGTIVNSEQLPPNIPVQLHSGDCIQIQELKIYFEWRDPNFQALVPSLQHAPEPKMTTQNSVALSFSTEGDAVEQLGEFENFGKLKNKKTMMRVALITALVIALVVGLFMPSDKKEQQALSSKNPNEQTLSPSQKAAARDSFQLALNLYKQGKYELCMSELHKLHQIIPQFENSKELEVFCSHGHELVLRQKDRERKDREQQAIQQQIQTVIAECRQKLKPFDAPEKHMQCLTPATELDPENREIQQIIKSAQDFETRRNEQRQAAAQRAGRILNGKKHFEKAQKLQKQGNLKGALSEYMAYLNADYPSNETEEELAKREVGSLKREISERIQSRLDTCMQAASKNQWKTGYLSCDEVLKEDPSNAKARQERDRMLSELRREMKAIYEDSVLEESLGNVDTAKEKWKKIKEDNLPFDDYTKKASQKLRKYGIGM